MRVDDEGDYVFELAERTGADRLWHLRRGDDVVVVRAPEGVAAAGARAARGGDGPPERVRRFDRRPGGVAP